MEWQLGGWSVRRYGMVHMGQLKNLTSYHHLSGKRLVCQITLKTGRHQITRRLKQ